MSIDSTSDEPGFFTPEQIAANFRKAVADAGPWDPGPPVELPPTDFNAYEELTCRLIGIEHLPLADMAALAGRNGDGDIDRPAALDDVHEQGLCAAVCCRTNGMSVQHWAGLDMAERIPWMWAALADFNQPRPSEDRDVESEMPWENEGWEPPTPQIARIIRFMWNRDQASCDVFMAHVWGNDTIRDNTICTALSRANEYLGRNRHSRALEKVRADPVVRWV